MTGLLARLIDRALRLGKLPTERRPYGLHAIDEIVRLLGQRRPLELLSIAYVAQAAHLDMAGRPLFEADFLASAMGPMDERVFDHIKGAMRRERGRGIEPQVLTESERAALAAAIRVCGHLVGGERIRFIQHVYGAWHHAFRPDPVDLLPISDPRRHRMKRRSVWKGPSIQQGLLATEWRNRMSRGIAA